MAIPAVASQAPNPAYNVDKFEYNAKGDYYVCQFVHKENNSLPPVPGTKPGHIILNATQPGNACNAR